MIGPEAMRPVLVWAGVATAIAAPSIVAATSPLLAWRDPMYITGCLAGVAALALMFLQPLLAGGYLPGLRLRLGRSVHAWVGGALVAAVAAHVATLWLTSPPDVIDALLFRSPTPFSVWGVVAMWAVFATALLAALRRWQRLRSWRLYHMGLAVVVVVATVVHAMLVEGTMGLLSKAALCALVLAATAKVILDARLPAALRRLARQGRDRGEV
jgi:hypothetical protein